MPQRSYFLFFVTIMGFGSAFALTQISVSVFSPLWVAAGRSLVACLGVLMAIAFLSRDVLALSVSRRDVLWAAVLMSVAPYVLISWGQQFLPSGFGGFVFASTPLFTLLLGWMLNRSLRPSAFALFGALVGLAGVAFSVARTPGLTPEIFAGAMATLLAAMSYSAGGLLLQRIQPRSMLGFAGAQLVPATAMLIAVALVVDGAPSVPLHVEPYIALLALGVLGTCLPLLAIFRLVSLEGAQIASVTTFFIPFVAVGIGAAFMNEPLHWTLLVGVAAVTTGSFLIFRFRSKAP